MDSSATTLETLETRTGFRFLVRPVVEADAQPLAHFFASVSDDDRRFRFLSSAPAVTSAQLHDMTHCDHHHRENFLAFAPDSNEIIAAGTLAADASLDVGEVAISIRSGFKGRGIGWTLLQYLADQAKARGVKRLQSIESRQNHAAIDLEREQGFVARELEGDPSLMLLERTL
ncbi:GNAT family N-acetyltransferase [Sphingobium aquiterrae]|uniref:GNAT family N-acetyltransferase n=1 Tax=Sphingobium aquiterrae TaxID=2038656 RepID=UPI003016B563